MLLVSCLGDGPLSPSRDPHEGDLIDCCWSRFSCCHRRKASLHRGGHTRSNWVCRLTGLTPPNGPVRVWSLPHEAMLLRWTAALKEKREQLERHRKAGYVQDDVPTVIAVNSCRLSWSSGRDRDHTTTVCGRGRVPYRAAGCAGEHPDSRIRPELSVCSFLCPKP